ncbi:hypothetical protein M407DRAFT_243989, partial [Tulasnella calospora MUT 4182]
LQASPHFASQRSCLDPCTSGHMHHSTAFPYFRSRVQLHLRGAAGVMNPKTSEEGL